MRKSVNLSFLVPVHNEERILDKTLNHLSKLPYKNYEVLIGLDGCDDNSEEIAKQYVKKYPMLFRYFSLNERNGKPEVLDKLIKYAKGEIIIINDADWLFISGYKDGIEKLVKIFDDKKIGGIAESFTIEWSKKMKSKSVGFLGEMWADRFWLGYQKENFTFRKDGKLYIDKKKLKFPFLVNIFRKSLYKKNYTLCDDFERCFDIIEKGYNILLFEDENMPRFIATYKKTSIKDLFKKKIRTAFARKQLTKKYDFKIKKNLYIKIFFYFLKNMYKIKNLKSIVGLFLWIIAMLVGELKSKLGSRKIKTKDGWNMRAER